MNELYCHPTTIPLSAVELDTHPDRDRIIATVLEGLDARGSLGIVYDCAIEAALDDGATQDAIEEGEKEGTRAGLELGLETLNELQRDIIEHEPDLDGVIDSLQEAIDRLTDKLE